MAPQKRNKFLEAEESEEEDIGGYDSEEELQKGGGRTAKRRKVEDEDDLSEEEDAGDFSEEEDEEADDQQSEGGTENKTKAQKSSSADELPGLSKPLTKKNLVATEKAVKKSGVVYLSRVPPFMKPQKLRSLLEPYGKINRIFLSPEDPEAHKQRVRHGGNKKRSYTDGWVEFVNKKEAKAAVELLNARTIGGKKGSYYRDDIWNLLYLHGFKWHNLTEQISAEAAERASRMRAEITRTTKENKEFVRNVEKAKMLEGIQSKAAAKNKDKDTNDQPGQARARRTFEQAPVAKKKDDKLPQDAQRVASMLF